MYKQIHRSFIQLEQKEVRKKFYSVIQASSDEHDRDPSVETWFYPHTVLINKSFNCSCFVKIMQNYRGHQLECNYQIILTTVEPPCMTLTDLELTSIGN